MIFTLLRMCFVSILRMGRSIFANARVSIYLPATAIRVIFASWWYKLYHVGALWVSSEWEDLFSPTPKFPFIYMPEVIKTRVYYNYWTSAVKHMNFLLGPKYFEIGCPSQRNLPTTYLVFTFQRKGFPQLISFSTTPRLNVSSFPIQLYIMNSTSQTWNPHFYD